MAIDYLERILGARVYDVANETPLELAAGLSARLDNRILLKREDAQPVFSFKVRGAYNRMARLSASELRRGVITASAGNHAQGVALAAQTLGCRAVIVMPVTTPHIKVDAVRARGADVVLHGDAYADAHAHARALERRRRLVFVHPYDDPDVIAGQGTVGMEILRQAPRPLHAVLAPVGGGGLIGGIAAYVKRLRPEVRVIGVQPVDADAMARSLRARRRVALPRVGLFADGVAVRQVGVETFRLARELVDEMVLVDTDEICAAIKDVFEDTRSILEPAGALAVAGAKRYVADAGLRGKDLVAVASGANVDFDRLRFVAERAEVGEAREALLGVTLPERPGSLRSLCAAIGERGITELSYRMTDPEAARVFVGVEVRDRKETRTLLRALRRSGFPAIDLSDDELAKQHVRHLIGGHASPPDAGAGAAATAEELLYRFEFPERPGALARFLERMRSSWNISLFHYRNQGSSYGRVLVGMQVPRRDERAFARFLADVGYPYVDERGSAAYATFLA